MKRIIALILLLGLFLDSFSQTEAIALKATSLFDPDLRLFYIGVPNNLVIENNKDTNVFLGITGGTCEKINSTNNLNHYQVWVSTGLKQSTISIYKKKLLDTLLIDTVNFTVLRIPDPKAMLGNLIDSIAAVEALMLQSEIKTFLPCYYKLAFPIISFTIGVTKTDNSYHAIKAYGNIITKKQKQLIKNLKPGDILWIEDIKCHNTSGCTRVLSAIKIKVK